MQKFVLKPATSSNSTLPEGFYDGLNEGQLQAVTFDAGPVLVIAGAGSGKTKTLVHRVARLVAEGVPAEAVLLLTFTRKASQEMLARATGILDSRCRNVSGGTFHSFANILLREFSQSIGFPNNFTILDRSDAEDLIGAIRKEMGLNTSDKRYPKKGTINTIISKSINTSRSIDSILQQDFPQYWEFSDDIEKIATQFQQRKSELFVMDYDDLLVYLYKMLRDDADVRRRVQDRYQYIMVDEYQDTNLIQGEIVLMLAGDKQNVMVVGDDCQSIYSFRGAHYKNIINFPQLFPDATQITLSQNYRSTQPILDITNAVIEQATEKFAKRLFTENKGTAKPVYIETASENEQSRFICQRILELREQGVSLSEIAVLFRSSTHANDLEVELQAANVPYVKYGGFKFTETSHVKDLVALLRILYNVSDGVCWQRILLMMEGLGPKAASQIISDVLAHRADLSKFPGEWATKRYGAKVMSLVLLVQTIGGLTPSEVLDLVMDFYKPLFEAKYDDFPKRQSDLESLRGIAGRYDNLQEFLSEISLEPPDGSAEATAETKEDEKLVLSTIHSSKGLEWHTVFVMSLVDGYLPSFRSLDDAAQIEEERRLLYVALTRAREQLYLLKPHIEASGSDYFRYQGFQFTRVSRFLDDRELLSEFTEKCVLVDDQVREKDDMPDPSSMTGFSLSNFNKRAGRNRDDNREDRYGKASGGGHVPSAPVTPSNPLGVDRKKYYF
ncbi:MAG: UvrD-helicase domain-containing protein [bacterium]|nr:UvrD-helicase domain-containing protein [bacterium]